MKPNKTEFNYLPEAVYDLNLDSHTLECTASDTAV